MASIHTLVADLYAQLDKRGWFTNELALKLSQDISRRLAAPFNDEQNTPTLRISALGPRCSKALWHSIHTPQLAEALPPWATLKYTYGHIIEALILNLAKVAGHQVEGEQDELTVDGIRGHRDAVIDGCIVDVKSCSSIQFAKYKDRSIRENDSFGYLDQLDGYLVGSATDNLVTDKEHGYILAVDKTLGKICLYEHRVREQSIRDRIQTYKRIIAQDRPPECTCGTIADGKSGNIRLDTKASYSAYKHCCFPSLRTFLYAEGPRYLTHVARLPDVQELDRSGQIIYNYS